MLEFLFQYPCFISFRNVLRDFYRLCLGQHSFSNVVISLYRSSMAALSLRLCNPSPFSIFLKADLHLGSTQSHSQNDSLLKTKRLSLLGTSLAGVKHGYYCSLLCILALLGLQRRIAGIISHFSGHGKPRTESKAARVANCVQSWISECLFYPVSSRFKPESWMTLQQAPGDNSAYSSSRDPCELKHKRFFGTAPHHSAL